MKRISNQADPILFVLTLLATVIGALIIYNAGYARSIQMNAGWMPREFRSQILFGLIGIGAGYACSRASAQKLKLFSRLLFVASVTTLILVELFGKEMNGAKRWLDLKLFLVQPAEFAKLAVILFLAAVFADRKPAKEPRRVRHFAEWMDKVFTPKLKRAMPAIWVLFAVGLIEIEPDLGTAAIVLVTACVMLILGGVSRKSLMVAGVLVLAGLTVLTIKEPYRIDRILNHSARWSSDLVDDVGYQTTHSESAMATGGWLGVGLGSGRAKHMLPAATTDFVMATVGEEFGVFGSLGILALIGGVVFRLMWLSGRAHSKYGRLVLGGTAAWIGVQSCVNFMMANGTLPAIGIPLPFISSGGSSLLALWLSIGVCQAMVAEQPQEEDAVETRRHGWRHGRTRLSRA